MTWEYHKHYAPGKECLSWELMDKGKLQGAVFLHKNRPGEFEVFVAGMRPNSGVNGHHPTLLKAQAALLEAVKVPSL